MFKVGDKVRVIGGRSARGTQLAGQICTVEVVFDHNGNYSYAFLVEEPKETAGGKWGVYLDELVLVSSHCPDPEDMVAALRYTLQTPAPTGAAVGECTCPTLLAGHHSGCPYVGAA